MRYLLVYWSVKSVLASKRSVEGIKLLETWGFGDGPVFLLVGMLLLRKAADKKEEEKKLFCLIHREE